MQLSPSFFDAGRDVEGVFSAVMLFRPAVVVGPPGGEPAASPEEAVALLRQNEGLSIISQQAVHLAGQDGIQVDVVATHEATQVLGERGALLSIDPDTDLRLTFLPADGGILVIGVLRPADEE